MSTNAKEHTYHRRQFLKPSKYQNPVTFAMTPAALRARKPFFWGNMATTAVAFSIVGGIYAYTLYAFQADNFQDVAIPPVSDDELAILRRKRDEAKAATAAAVAAAKKD